MGCPGSTYRSAEMEDDFSQIVQPPVTEEVGPGGGCSFEGGGGDDGASCNLCRGHYSSEEEPSAGRAGIRN